MFFSFFTTWRTPILGKRTWKSIADLSGTIYIFVFLAILWVVSSPECWNRFDEPLLISTHQRAIISSRKRTNLQREDIHVLPQRAIPLPKRPRVDHKPGRTSRKKRASNLKGNTHKLPAKYDGLSNTKQKIFFVPGKETRCTDRFNYICRFWFHVRCIIFRDVRNIVVVPDYLGGLERAAQLATRGDAIIFVTRSSHHRAPPWQLKYLLQMQKNRPFSEELMHVKIGVFHIAPEFGRSNWPWYKLPDFVIRMYWVSSNLPTHIISIPIGAQYLDNCMPSFIQDSIPKKLSSSTNSFEMNPTCSCGKKKIIPASQRPYLWSFSASIRRHRLLLVRSIQQNEKLRRRGILNIVRKFGGDNHLGSRNSSLNPKTKHLKMIEQSMFVFAPCGNVMETHRLYEAISLGAIPVVENCEPKQSPFLPFRDTIINGGVVNMTNFVSQYAHNRQAVEILQKKMMNWWASYIDEVARNVSRVIMSNVTRSRRQPIL